MKRTTRGHSRLEQELLSCDFVINEIILGPKQGFGIASKTCAPKRHGSFPHVISGAQPSVAAKQPAKIASLIDPTRGNALGEGAGTQQAVQRSEMRSPMPPMPCANDMLPASIGEVAVIGACNELGTILESYSISRLD